MEKILKNKKIMFFWELAIVLIVALLVIFFLDFGAESNKDNSMANVDAFYLDDKYYGDGRLVLVTASAFDTYKEDSYILYVSGISNKLAYSCDEVFGEFTKNNKIDFLSITNEEFKKTKLSKEIKSTPTVIIAKDGEVVAYLDINKKEDINKYQDQTKLKNWLSKYIYLEKK